MSHIRNISVARASVEPKGFDPFGAVFLQIWLTLAALLISTIAGTKD